MSGSSLEKPLITAFKGNGNTYVVFDNEINGTMGLPIILVSKLTNNTLTKITDPNEWSAVKESLRMIIAGNQVDYVTCDASLGGEDVFFSQLTLPVASFEALKNNYKPIGDVANPSPMGANVSGPDLGVNMNISSSDPNIVNPGMPNSMNMGGFNSQPVMNENPVTPQVVNPMEMNQQNVAQVIEPAPVTPVMPSAPVENQTIAQVTPEPVNVEPIPDVVPQQNTPVDFTADKEAFLKACENMFDALVAKFKN